MDVLEADGEKKVRPISRSQPPLVTGSLRRAAAAPPLTPGRSRAARRLSSRGRGPAPGPLSVTETY